MKRSILKHLISTCLLAVTAFSANAQEEALDALSPIQSYLTHTQAVIDEIQKTAPNIQVIESQVGEMLSLIPQIYIRFSELHPKCQSQLEAIDALLPAINGWSAVDIRRKIEAGTALPPGAPECYAARDIVAHPAIVRALSRSQNPAQIRERLQHEIAEALEHGTEIADEFARNDHP